MRNFASNEKYLEARDGEMKERGIVSGLIQDWDEIIKRVLEKISSDAKAASGGYGDYLTLGESKEKQAEAVKGKERPRTRLGVERD